MSVMLKQVFLPNDDTETGFFMEQRRTCYSTVYPFKFFPQKGLEKISFEPITIFYGNNGSGKSTLLNIISEKIGAKRRSPFNGSAFFSDYLKFCKCKYQGRKPDNIQILTSDDVSEYILDLRYLNDGIDGKREELFNEYLDKKYSNYKLKSLDDYDEFKTNQEAKRKSQSAFVRSNLMQNPDMHSNGETAIRYFVDSITENGIYLMDEPENSLSASLQLELMKYIQASARHFNCQFIIASHSPIFLSIPDAKIYNLDLSPVDICKWNDLENVKILYRLFKERDNDFI